MLLNVASWLKPTSRKNGNDAASAHQHNSRVTHTSHKGNTIEYPHTRKSTDAPFLGGIPCTLWLAPGKPRVNATLTKTMPTNMLVLVLVFILFFFTAYILYRICKHLELTYHFCTMVIWHLLPWEPQPECNWQAYLDILPCSEFDSQAVLWRAEVGATQSN